MTKNRIFILWAFLILSACTLSTKANAATFNINAADLQTTIDTAASTDVINVTDGGTYSGNILINTDGLTINGPVTVDGTGNTLFVVGSSALNTTLTEVTVNGGRTQFEAFTNVSITSCTFQNNAANHGLVANGDSIVAVDCTFSGNGSSGINLNSGTLDVTNCNFTNNALVNAGHSGIRVTSICGDVTVENCTFDGNGSGIQINGTTEPSQTTAINNCTIINSTDNGISIWNNGFGGGDYTGNTITVSNTSISGNNAAFPGTYALYGGNAIAIQGGSDNGTITLDNVTGSNSTVCSGIELGGSGWDINILNSNFTGNAVDGCAVSFRGGPSTVTLQNTTVTDWAGNGAVIMATGGNYLEVNGPNTWSSVNASNAFNLNTASDNTVVVNDLNVTGGSNIINIENAAGFAANQNCDVTLNNCNFTEFGNSGIRFRTGVNNNTVTMNGGSLSFAAPTGGKIGITFNDGGSGEVVTGNSVILDGVTFRNIHSGAVRYGYTNLNNSYGNSVTFRNSTIDNCNDHGSIVFGNPGILTLDNTDIINSLGQSIILLHEESAQAVISGTTQINIINGSTLAGSPGGSGIWSVGEAAGTWSRWNGIEINISDSAINNYGASAIALGAGDYVGLNITNGTMNGNGNGITGGLATGALTVNGLISDANVAALIDLGTATDISVTGLTATNVGTGGTGNVISAGDGIPVSVTASSMTADSANLSAAINVPTNHVVVVDSTTIEGFQIPINGNGGGGNDITVRNGCVFNGTGGVNPDEYGLIISNNNTLSVSDTTISNYDQRGISLGVANDVTISSSTLTGNAFSLVTFGADNVIDMTASTIEQSVQPAAYFLAGGHEMTMTDCTIDAISNPSAMLIGAVDATTITLNNCNITNVAGAVFSPDESTNTYIEASDCTFGTVIAIVSNSPTAAGQTIVLNDCTMSSSGRAFTISGDTELTLNNPVFAGALGDVAFSTYGAFDGSITVAGTPTQKADFAPMHTGGTVLPFRINGGTLNLTDIISDGKAGGNFFDARFVGAWSSTVTLNLEGCEFLNGSGNFDITGASQGDPDAFVDAGYPAFVNATNCIWNTTPYGQVIDMAGNTARTRAHELNLEHCTFTGSYATVWLAAATTAGSDAVDDQVTANYCIFDASQGGALDGNGNTAVALSIAVQGTDSLTWTPTPLGNGGFTLGQPVGWTTGVNPNLGADGRLTGSGPAIDGAAGSTQTRDIDGDARPEGSAADLGADEYIVPNAAIHWTIMQ